MDGTLDFDRFHLEAVHKLYCLGRGGRGLAQNYLGRSKLIVGRGQNLQFQIICPKMAMFEQLNESQRIFQRISKEFP